MTPLVVAKKGKETLNFYTDLEFSKWIEKNSSKGWNIEYKKGLASLEDFEYEEIIHKPKLVQIKKDPNHNDSLGLWFGSDSAPRKDKILNFDNR